MPQARPLLQAAREEHFGPIATRVLKSGKVRFKQADYTFEIVAHIETLGVFPAIEFNGRGSCRTGVLFK